MDKTIYSRSKVFTGFMKGDGSKMYADFEDKGIKIPGIVKNGEDYDHHVTYTTWWRLFFSNPRRWDGKQVVHRYIQLEKGAVDFSGGILDEANSRWLADQAMLTDEGVDIERGLTLATPQDIKDIIALSRTIEMPRPMPFTPFKPSGKVWPVERLSLRWHRTPPSDSE